MKLKVSHNKLSVLLKNPAGLYWLLIIWGILQAVINSKFGIVTKDEALKYLGESEKLMEGSYFSSPKYLFYSFYILIVSFFRLLGIPVLGTYLLQLLIGVFALIRFYQWACLITGSEKTAVFTSLLYLACFPLHVWDSHLYTESVFIHLGIFFGYSIHQCLLKNTKLWKPLPWLVLLIFSRPTGILFAAAYIFLIIRSLLIEKQYRLLLILCLVLLPGFVFTLNYSMKGGGGFDFMKPFLEGHVICGVPGTNATALVLPHEGNKFQGILFFVFHNPWLFLSLAFKKLIAFWGMTRSYYGTFHNLYLQLFFYPIYVLALVGVLSKNSAWILIRPYLLTCVVLFTISVLLTCDDWLNRFIMPILPMILLAAGLGMSGLFSFFSTDKSKRPTPT